MLDGNSIYDPKAEDIRSFAIEFAQMMFAHARFESEVRALQAAVTCVRGFGENRRNQWGSIERPKLMTKLITKHRGAIPEAKPIEEILEEAIEPCKSRNLLAHGEWWRFDKLTSEVEVRGGTQWEWIEGGWPEHSVWMIGDIAAITEKFKDLEAELFKLRRAIEQRTPCPDSIPDAD